MKRLILCVLLLAWPAVAVAAERILALSPHACEILFAVGAGEQVVGAVDYCDHPEAARSLPRVGSYRRLHAEAALRLRPTLAVATGASLPGLERLRALGVRVVVSRPRTLAGVIDEVRRLGRMAGRAARGEALARELERRLAALRARRVDPPPRLFYEIWPAPLMAAGGTGFIGDVIAAAGAENVFGDVAREAPRVGLAAVLRRRPEVIVLPSGDRDVAARRRFWRRWLGEKVRFVSLPADLLQRPGPRLFDAAERLGVALRGGEGAP